jgi:hypothetical protein
MQRISLSGAATILALMVLIVAHTADAEQVETRTFEQSLAVDDGRGASVTVANVLGPVRVTAHEHSRVELRATETIRGETAADIERARSQVRLVTERTDTGLAFRVQDEGNDPDCRCSRRWEDFSVTYDIELAVPHSVSVELSTVSDGDITLNGVHGDFDVSNVNGSVLLHGLRGTGHASTVNGQLEAWFERAPVGRTAFETVNGPIQVTFPADLSADLTFKTRLGEVWTDFEVEPVPVTPVRERTRDGKSFRIRSEQRSVVRVTSGGPLHMFETFNGDIHVYSQPRAY